MDREDGPPLELHVAVQLITDLLQVGGEFLVVWVTEFSSAQLSSGHHSGAFSTPLNALKDEAAHEKRAEVIILTLPRPAR